MVRLAVVGLLRRHLPRPDVLRATRRAETLNLLARPSQAPPDVPTPSPTPSLKQAVGSLSFAVLFALAMWLEHRWLLARGGYPEIITWLALAVCVGRLFWVSRILIRRW